MNPTKQRLTDLGTSWEDSDAPVTLAPADALALGVTAKPGKPPAIRGGDILGRAQALPDDPDALPAGAEATPATQSDAAKGDPSAKPKK